MKFVYGLAVLSTCHSGCGLSLVTLFCLLGTELETFYRYDPGDGQLYSPYKRNNSNVPFRSQSLYNSLPAPWAATSPQFPTDRQVAWGQYFNVTQGVYVCANGGNCTAPDLCHCAPGYIGFDCRYGWTALCVRVF